MQLVEVGLLQLVTSLCRHVRHVLIELRDLDVFQQLLREAPFFYFA